MHSSAANSLVVSQLIKSRPSSSTLEGFRQVFPRRHLVGCALAWTAFVIYGSLVPFAFRPLEIGPAISGFREILGQPISASLRSDFAANVLLFIPLGFMWLGVVSSGVRRTRALLFALPIIVGCVVLSVCVEFTQLWFPPRTSSVNDVFAESLGALVGCVLWALMGAGVVAWLDTLIHSESQRDKAKKILLAYCVLFAIYSVMPADLTISLHEIYQKYRDGRILVIPFSYHYDSAFSLAYSSIRDALCMVPVGIYSSVCLLPPGRTIRGLGRSIALGMAYVVSLEAIQLLVISRYSDATDLVTGLAGVVVGSSAMQFRHGNLSTSPAPAAQSRALTFRWILVGAAFAVILALGYWYPFNFVMDEAAKLRLEGFASAPLSSIFWGSELNALSQVFLKVVTFALLGGCLAMAIAHMAVTNPARKALRVVAIVLCFGLGMAIELGQAFLPGHVADITDALLYGVGSLVGVALVSWWRDGPSLRDPDSGDHVSEVRRSTKI